MNFETEPYNLRLATRSSPLALAQAEQTVRALTKAHSGLAKKLDVKIKNYRTTGDRIESGKLSAIGGKGLFTKEIEQALISNDADLAVHSLKDMPTELPEGLVIAAYLSRADFREALIGGYTSLNDLPLGAKVGTASLRRQAILKNIRPDLVIQTLRGNVDTRLRRVSNGDFDATLLAVAGLKRLGRVDAASAILSPDQILPAACQGIIAVECREDDSRLREILSCVDHRDTRIAATVERAFLSELDGSCRMPIAALALVQNDLVSLRGLIARPDGSELLEIIQGDDLESALWLSVVSVFSLSITVDKYDANGETDYILTAYSSKALYNEGTAEHVKTDESVFFSITTDEMSSAGVMISLDNEDDDVLTGAAAVPSVSSETTVSTTTDGDNDNSFSSSSIDRSCFCSSPSSPTELSLISEMSLLFLLFLLRWVVEDLLDFVPRAVVIDFVLDAIVIAGGRKLVDVLAGGFVADMGAIGGRLGALVEGGLRLVHAVAAVARASRGAEGVRLELGQVDGLHARHRHCNREE